MGAGEKIRAAVLKVATKVPGSDKAIALKVDTVPAYNPATESRPAAVTATLANFGQACEVRNISQQKAVALTGGYEAGDLEILVPAESVTEAQLRQAGVYLVYGTVPYDLVRIDPISIDFGVVTEWRLVARKRATNG